MQHVSEIEFHFRKKFNINKIFESTSMQNTLGLFQEQ